MRGRAGQRPERAVSTPTCPVNQYPIHPPGGSDVSGAQSQKGRVVESLTPGLPPQVLGEPPGCTQPRTGPPEDHEETICGRGGLAVPAALPAPHIFCSIVSSPAGPLMAQHPTSFPLSLTVFHKPQLSQQGSNCPATETWFQLTEGRGTSLAHMTVVSSYCWLQGSVTSVVFLLRPLALFSLGQSLLLRRVLCLVTGGLKGPVLAYPSQSYGRRIPIKILISLA